LGIEFVPHFFDGGQVNEAGAWSAAAITEQPCSLVAGGLIG
jgi:hypothetical protein